MKPAREVAHLVCEMFQQIGICHCVDGRHRPQCDAVTAAIEAAREEGATWMREQAAEQTTNFRVQRAIRAIPTVPK